MGNSKIVYFGETLIDLTGDTVEAAKLRKGITAHDKKGEKVTGTLADVTQATPAITVDAAGKITASATQSAGVVAAGTKSATKQLTVQAAKTVTPSSSAQTAIAKGVFTTGIVTVAAVYAVIGVTYPSGATCTCTNGSTTLTAKDTSGKEMFIIPSAGTWTVTATSGSKTKSKAVEITAEGQTESIILRYELLLYDAGDQCTDVTGGWIAMPRSGYVTNDPIFNDNNFVVEPTNSNGECGALPANKIDLTNVKTLHFYLKSEGGGSWAGNPEYYPDDTQNAQAVGASTVQSARIDNYRMAADVKISEMADYKDYPVDVSALTGEHYILIATVNLANYWYAKLTVTKVWGEYL